MRISDWSSDVCSSDLDAVARAGASAARSRLLAGARAAEGGAFRPDAAVPRRAREAGQPAHPHRRVARRARATENRSTGDRHGYRSEEHTSELQSLMRLSSSVFCLKTKTNATLISNHHLHQT